MRDGGRLSAAMEILADIETRRRPVQDALKDWGLTHRFAGSRDRNAIGNLVYDVLRRKASFGALMGSDAPRPLVLATYALGWGRGVDGLLAACDPGDRHAPAPPEARELSAIRSTTLPADTPDHVRADLPEWLMADFRRALGADVVEEGRALADRAGIDLRVNSLKASRPAVLEALAPLGATPTPYAPLGLRLPAGTADDKAPQVTAEFAYKRGEIEIQDEGSQIAAAIAAVGGAGLAVDLCAGGGGKSLALAAAFAGAGRIYAYDNDKRRFGDIFDRIARSGAANIDVVEPAAGDSLAFLDATADLVVVDAPCTGTGTWRRRPDAKWRLAPGALDMRLKQQAEVLARAARLVKPGGRIVYVTCSLLPQENEDQITAFLGRDRRFRLADTAALWPEALGVPLPDGLRLELSGGTALRLTPRRCGTDGFFIARLDRQAG